MAQVKFIIEDRELKTTRERELRSAEARAHAARISHQRKGTASRTSRIVPLRVKHTELIHKGTTHTGVGTEEDDPPENDNFLSRMLGGGRIDPFETSPIRKLPDYILSILDNAWMDIWSALRPHRQIGVIHPDIYAWRTAGLSCDALFHAYVAGAAGIALARGVGQELREQIGRTQIYHTVKAINGVSQELSKNDGPPSDSLLLAVMTLSGHGEAFADEGQEEPYVRSPLVQANRVNVFARLSITPAHSQAIGSLIMKKGGIGGIVLPGFRRLLCLTDLLQSTIQTTQPMLPYVGVSESLVSSRVHTRDAKASARAAILGTGFWVEGFPAIDADFQAILLAACELTTALDHFQRKENNPPVWVDIIEFRSWVQYRVLSLQPRLSASLDIQDYTYEACRLATLIYADLNIWPLPKSTKTRSRLAGKLHEVMTQRAGSEGAAISNDFLLWIGMMGAIAARHTKYEDYFLDLLARDTRVLSWPSFSLIMLEFLWCDFAVAPLARPLWQQARAMKKFHEFPYCAAKLPTNIIIELDVLEHQNLGSTLEYPQTQFVASMNSCQAVRSSIEMTTRCASEVNRAVTGAQGAIEVEAVTVK
ncbi:uncharacterized protein A1O9_09590 [Exophiala aquamarina CBS 119918]|uniref:Transcription factor domain-containing protein n=1 Tax=Exophiala aquamarina CBS 119918 TaxID=1182545 RepID=A0A072P571_9EURO|nr:uncharacterized protein A1O9_09590 [Exophiala aquamarina CBS 119918]KEF54423.1 hypothetical protein A1O9_09590 [Exophiala aquamarina CBS 119918]